MFTHNPNAMQQNSSDLNAYHLADATRRFLDEEARRSSSDLWICPGCGMTHAGMLPEECSSCGATGLEFQYTASSNQEICH